MSFIESEGVRVYHGDCIEIMRTLPDASVDSVVTDPPYLIDFMGKGWDAADGIAGKPEVWREALRVLKPGGHLLAFGGTRTWHRLAVAIEDAGFDIRDSICWLYASGFPKSLDVSKAIDRKRDDRENVLRVTGEIARLRDVAGLTNRDLDDAFGFAGMAGHWTSTKSQPTVPTVEQWAVLRDMLNPDEWLDAEVWRLNGRKGQPGEAWTEREVTGQHEQPTAQQVWMQNYSDHVALPPKERKDKPATPAAQQWQGWGTALKPAFEPIVVARKPLIGTVAENVLAHGTGALNIDGCRIGTEERINPSSHNKPTDTVPFAVGQETDGRTATGRWPANVILDESQAAELDKQSGVTSSTRSVMTSTPGGVYGGGKGLPSHTGEYGFDDTGGASRFFYCAKAPKKERPNVDGVAHPTVKPIALMRYLVRLVTPPGGTVLEPFAGSGTTVEACILEGFDCIAIEMTDDYLPLINERVRRANEDKEGRLL